MTKKHALPEFLAGLVMAETYARWLSRKAVAHVRRDRNRGRACTVSAYKQEIHEAVVRSAGRDAYTGEHLDWSLISTYRNDESQAGRHSYKAGFSLLPTVDHMAADVHDSEFRICAWRTNDAKNDLSLADFRALCARVLRHAEEPDSAGAAAEKAPAKNCPGPLGIGDIIECLSRHRQRATYGAVAGVVGRLPRSVMSGRPKTQENSWVVSLSAGLPTGYGEEDMHPDLQSRSKILSTAEELLAWLRLPR